MIKQLLISWTRKFKNDRSSRAIIVRTCAVFLGLVFLTAGTGKMLDQTRFIHTLEASFFTPVIAGILARFIPWFEIIVGLLLIFGFAPRITSIICIGLVSGFIVSNSWELLKAQTSFTCGDCFGIWETVLVPLSPLQALLIDIILIFLALIILTQTASNHPLFGFWRKRRNR